MDHFYHVLAVALVAGVLSWGVKRIPAIDEKFKSIFDTVLVVGVAIYAVRELLLLAN